MTISKELSLTFSELARVYIQCKGCKTSLTINMNDTTHGIPPACPTCKDSFEGIVASLDGFRKSYQYLSDKSVGVTVALRED